MKIGDVLIARRREDKVLTHLEDLITYLGSVREARKIVLVFTNGWLLYRPDPATHELIMKTLIDEYRAAAAAGRRRRRRQDGHG